MAGSVELNGSREVRQGCYTRALTIVMRIDKVQMTRQDHPARNHKANKVQKDEVKICLLNNWLNKKGTANLFKLFIPMYKQSPFISC